MEARGYPVHLEISDELGRGLAVIIGLVAAEEPELGRPQPTASPVVLQVRAFGVPASEEGAREIADLLVELGQGLQAQLDGLMPPKPRPRFNPTAPGPRRT